MSYLFRHAKLTYDSIVPLRGKRKAQDIRPLGQRRKTWERIIKIDDDTYAYRCYSTDVVTVSRDGSMFINHAGWVSNTTTEFINKYVPTVYAFRQYGLMWIRVGTKYYPIPRTGLQFKDEVLETDLKVYKKVINREKSKELRKQTADFITFAKTMLPIIDWSQKYNVVGHWPTHPYTEESRDTWIEQLMKMQQSKWVHGVGWQNTAPRMDQVRATVNRYTYSIHQPYDLVEAELGVCAEVVIF